VAAGAEARKVREEPTPFLGRTIYCCTGCVSIPVFRNLSNAALRAIFVKASAGLFPDARRPTFEISSDVCASLTVVMLMSRRRSAVADIAVI
jgi:hypothetical protein